jgi:hypothetical protein
MNKKKDLPRISIIPPSPQKATLQNHLDSMHPLPLGDMTTDPLMYQPWWKFQTMYYHHLLRWHPDHPNAIDPTSLDPILLLGPAAKLTLVIRDLVLESRKGLNLDYQKGIPKEITAILPLIQSLISLDYLTCMYTIFLPIMGNTLPTTAWNHLFDTLQLILASMKAHTICESGTQRPFNIYHDKSYSPYNDIGIPLKLTNLIHQFKGTLWRSEYRLIINIPSTAWIEYGSGLMNIQIAHNFEQIAWIQICQFNARDLKEAIDHITLSEDIQFSTKLWDTYKEKNQFKINYIQLIYQCKVYAILEQFATAEAQKTLAAELDKPLTPNSPVHNYNSVETQTIAMNDYIENWDTDLSSSECENV